MRVSSWAPFWFAVATILLLALAMEDSQAAAISVWSCPTGSQGMATVSLGSDQYPTCEAGQGAWVSVEPAEQFDPVAWFGTPEGSAEFGQFFAAAFIVVGMCYVLGWSAGALLGLIRLH